MNLPHSTIRVEKVESMAESSTEQGRAVPNDSTNEHTQSSQPTSHSGGLSDKARGSEAKQQPKVSATSTSLPADPWIVDGLVRPSRSTQLTIDLPSSLPPSPALPLRPLGMALSPAMPFLFFDGANNIGNKKPAALSHVDSLLDDLLWKMVEPALSSSPAAVVHPAYGSPAAPQSSQSRQSAVGAAAEPSQRTGKLNKPPAVAKATHYGNEWAFPSPFRVLGKARSNQNSRKEWLAWEDEAIRGGVEELGTRWRAIAARLPGRSDDAVRNRWARLQGQHGGSMSSEASSLSRPAVSRPAAGAWRQTREGGEPRFRYSWTAEEDEVILLGVSECGRRCNKIAQRLPRRTEHAIRNRWHRLQMNMLDEEQSAGLMIDVPEN